MIHLLPPQDDSLATPEVALRGYFPLQEGPTVVALVPVSVLDHGGTTARTRHVAQGLQEPRKSQEAGYANTHTRLLQSEGALTLCQGKSEETRYH